MMDKIQTKMKGGAQIPHKLGTYPFPSWKFMEWSKQNPKSQYYGYACSCDPNNKKKG